MRRSPSSTCAPGSLYNDGRTPEHAPAGETGAQAASRHLTAHLHEVPVHVIPCITGRPEGMAPADLAWFYGSIIQAGWSFQLAARARGLGSVWTTHHLDYEREAAELLGIPFDEVTQVALIPVASHDRHRLQARAAESARDGAALGGVVAAAKGGGPTSWMLSERPATSRSRSQSGGHDASVDASTGSLASR